MIEELEDKDYEDNNLKKKRERIKKIQIKRHDDDSDQQESKAEVINRIISVKKEID